MQLLRPTRRRALAILAGAAASAAGGRAARAETFEWRGIALGADARLVLEGDRRLAESAVAHCIEEVARLEAIFSLHLTDSEICRLNRDGSLEAPSLDMVALLQQARAMHDATEGLFDPTIQPLWTHYAGQRPGSGIDAASGEGMVARLLAQVGMRHVTITTERIALRPGSAITLNGIAQGYITDRIADILRRMGWAHVLVDMGEVAVPGERAFDIEVPETALRLPLASAALATSSGALGFPGYTGARHILSPRTGRTPWHRRAVTVMHPSATIADGLSTALFIADRSQLARITRRHPGAKVWWS